MEPVGSALSPPSNSISAQDPTLGVGTPVGSLLDARPSMDMAPDAEWPGFFNFSDDFTDVLGISPNNPDTVNPQNLAFLYRFL